MLVSDSIPLHFLFEFLDIDANVSDVEITDEMFNKVIEEIKSNDRETRDRGITKYC